MDRYEYDFAKLKRLMYLVGVLILAAMLAAALSGCATTYEVHIDGDWLKVKSHREFKRIEATYGEFHVVASGVTDDTQEMTADIVSDVSEKVAEGIGWFLYAKENGIDPKRQ